MADLCFSKKSELPVSANEAFAWHARAGAIDRLIPPWERVQITKPSNGIASGSRVELVKWLGPLPLRWIAEHEDYEAGHQFRDIQVSGPFKKWEHTHRFEGIDQQRSELLDEIIYEIPGGPFGRTLGGNYIRSTLETMFQYRHQRTVADLNTHMKHKDQGTMHIAITGASGLVGKELTPLLTTGGHEVSRLVRRTPNEGEIRWDPQASTFDASALDGVDAVVHLAGKNIASNRWNAKVKAEIRDSRVGPTRALCEGLARMQNPPKTLVCASAIGFYGDRGDQTLNESAAAGEGYLPEVCQQWEAATQPASEAGIRVVNLRFGVILSPKDGALKKMLLPFQMGGGGILGSGKQYMSWIAIDDAAGAVLHAIMTDDLQGPVNTVAPDSCTNHTFTKTLGRVLSRPTILPMPAFAARLVMGEMADDLLLASTRVEPQRLLETGYEFRQPTLEDALRHLLGRPK